MADALHKQAKNVCTVIIDTVQYCNVAIELQVTNSNWSCIVTQPTIELSITVLEQHTPYHVLLPSYG